MEQKEQTQLGIRVPNAIRETLNKYCKDHGISQGPAIEMAIRNLAMAEEADAHPDYKADISTVTDALKIISDHYLSAINAINSEKTVANEKLRMVTEEARLEVCRYKAVLDEQQLQKEELKKREAELLHNLQILRDQNKVLEERLNLTEREKSIAEKETQNTDAMKKEISEYKTEIERLRKQNDEAFQKITILSSNLILLTQSKGNDEKHDTKNAIEDNCIVHGDRLSNNKGEEECV